MSKVFGIGWAKTGTTTLGECLTTLGFNHQSQRLDLVADVGLRDLTRVLEVAKNKESFEDWPWIILFAELDQAFPNSRFILTTREPERWIRSYVNLLNTGLGATAELNAIRRILYGLPFPNVTEAQLVQRYTQHNSDVTEYFKDRPECLLTVDWEKGAGWKELCDFLGVRVPGVPLPHANRSRY